MTLSTNVMIVEPTEVRPIFDEARRLIGGEHAHYDHDERSKAWGCGVYRNVAGQGLPALLYVRYGVDAPLEPDDDEDTGYPVQQWSIEVDFDTAYGYTAKNGAHCGDLHAHLVRELGHWLDERGLTWYWQLEYDGTWHKGSEIRLLGDPDLGRLSEE